MHIRLREVTSFTIIAILSGCGGGTEPTPADNTVASVTVSSSLTTIAPAGTVQLTATAKNAAGATISGQTATWSSSNQAFATVSTTGLVTGVANGAATITATIAGKIGTRVITVATIT